MALTAVGVLLAAACSSGGGQQAAAHGSSSGTLDVAYANNIPFTADFNPFSPTSQQPAQA